jgi:hypothetical protein
LEVNAMAWYQPRSQNFAPQARHKHSACVLNNQIWIFGGLQDPPKGFNDLHVLNLMASKDSATLHQEPPSPSKWNTQQDESMMLKQEIIRLKEELQKSEAKIEFLSARNLEHCSLHELEELELLYLSTLPR